jgi:hypothetical protein
MRKNAFLTFSVLLALTPLVWAGYMLVRYACELGVYAEEWRGGKTPGWLTLWVIIVTSAGLAIAGIVIPKIWRWWKKGRVLTRGEWVSLLVIAGLVALLALIAPTAMRSPNSEMHEFLGGAKVCSK